MTASPVGKLRLSVAMGDYDRTRALLDGRVLIDGVEPVFMTLSPEETFFRAMRQQAFDISELSLSSYLVSVARRVPVRGGAGVPVARVSPHVDLGAQGSHPHAAGPEGQARRRARVPAHRQRVGARDPARRPRRAPRDITWVRGGIETPGRPEKIELHAAGRRAARRRARGHARSPICSTQARSTASSRRARRPAAAARNPQVRWLFDDPTAAAKDWYRRTGIFPIMHVVGVRRELAEQHPWLPVAVLKAFTQAKAMALEALADTSATKVTLPFVEEQLKAARETLGDDFWSYGVAGNEATLCAFVRHHHAQGLSAREMALDELFHPSTFETHRI